MPTIARPVPRITASRIEVLDALSEILAALALLPPIAALVLSLGGSSPGENYARWWGTARGWETLWTTMQLGFLATVTALIAAWTMTTILVRSPSTWIWPLTFLTCAPLLIPSSTLGSAWIALAGRQGPLGGLLDYLGVSVYSFSAAAGALGMRYFGIAVAVLVCYQLGGSGSRAAEKIFAVPRWRAFVRLRTSSREGCW